MLLSLALLVVGALLPSCGKKPQNAAVVPNLPAVQVRTQTAEIKRRVATEEVVGTVRARQRATVEAKLSGRIERMPVVLGQLVKTGQLVARLDAVEIKARLDQAQATLEQAERDSKRLSALFDGQAVTRAEYDAADTRQRVAKSAVAEAKAMMGYVEILAPFDGVVTKKWADQGDLAMPGKPLADIEDPTALELEAEVPEAVASRVQRDARFAIRVDSLGQELAGVVSEIAPAADPASRTFRVKLALPPTPGLMSGQFARLVVPVGETSSVRVPAAAVVQRGQLEIIFVVANQHAQLRLVKTGRQIGDEVEVLAGLEASDSVVIDGVAQLVDGQPVEAK